jgi:hypothetical protein
MKALGLCTRQASKGRIYILWDIDSLMTRILSNPANQGGLSSTDHAHVIMYGHMRRWATGYRRSIGDGKVMLVPYSILLEEWPVGLCLKRGHTRINLSP